ncbi:MAG TPA: hypothetical protein VFP84_35535 [Kofleriaceae bacterium]|nr:hypothetical protein [Kofleriaceae bacterium]
MSMKEQLSEAHTESHDATPEAAPAERHHLPPAVYHQTLRVRPGDAAALAVLLDQHPELSQQILAVASSHAGMSTVRQAIELHRQGGGAGISKADQADIRAIAGDETFAPAAAKPAAPSIEKDYRPGGAAELESVTPAAAATSSKPAHAEPAWVAHARTYNAAHATLADEFNELTDFTCSGDGNALEPVDVARWQRHHGVAADGMVGPHTLAAARAHHAKHAAQVASNIAAVQGDSRPPV